ncbi:MAG: cya 3, partial [Planctomycetaceae bacterium]|nr:cya 3 [Planctomycetaceae bacterium]
LVANLAIAASNAVNAEGNSGTTQFTFTVTRSGDTSTATSVSYGVSGSSGVAATAPDFAGGVFRTGTITFAANETSKGITIDVAGDTTVESDEGFTVTLSNATNGAVITGATATGTILNDDVALNSLSLSLSSISISEVGGQTTATIQRTGSTAAALVVTLQSSDTSAATVPGTVTIPSGQQSATFVVTAVNNQINDGSHLVTISASANGFSPASSQLTITPAPVSTAPVVFDDARTLTEDSFFFAEFPATVDDHAGGQLTFFNVIRAPSHGFVQIYDIHLGDYYYVPNDDYNGPDSFTFQVNDGTLDSNIGTVSISVESVNDAPNFSLAGSGVAVARGAGPQTVVGFLTNPSAGPANESNQTLSLSISNDNNSLFAVQPSINLATGNLTYTAVSNATGPATVTVQLTDSGGTSSLDVNSLVRTFTITVTGVNQAPTDISFPATSVFENGGTNVFVGLINAIDPDFGNTFTYSLVGGTGSSDNASFFLSGNALTMIPNADFEAQSSYKMRVRATDQGGLAVEKALTINVIDLNDPPTNLTLLSTTITENNNANGAVGSLTASDPDAGNSFTFSLVGGAGSADNGNFYISGNTLMISSSANFETKSVYNIRLRVADQGGAAFEKPYTINVIDVNEPPTDLTLSPPTILEHNAPSATVGILSTDDPDIGNTFIFGLVPGIGGDDNGSFFVSGNTLRVIPSTDFVTKNSYAIRVRVADQNGLAFEKSLIVKVVNRLESPTDISLSSTSLVENKIYDSIVGTFSASDPNASSTFAFSLVSGVGSNDNSSFFIDGDKLTIIPSTNFEAKSSYSIRVRVTNQDLQTFDKTFSITIIDLNEPPTDLSLSATSLAENNAANATVGLLGASDPDLNSVLSFSLVSGAGSADNASFFVAGNTLSITPSTNSEAKSNYAIRLAVTDQGGLTFEKAFTISIINVNEPPSEPSLSSMSIVENNPVDTTVGTLSATDPDVGSILTFSFVDGTGSTDNSSFFVNGNTLAIAPSANFEAKSSYAIRLRVADQFGLMSEKAFTISVLNSPEAPTDIGLSTRSIAENQSSGDIVGSFSSTDPDNGDTFTYSLVAGAGSANNNWFTISDGELRPVVAFDFEAKSTYSIRVRTTDHTGLTFEKPFTIAVTDTNDQPTDLLLSSTNIPENNLANALIGTLSATDQDPGSTFTFSLVSGPGNDDNGSFSIAGNSLMIIPSANFETQPSYSIRLRVADQGTLAFEKSFIIHVINKNEPPTDIFLTSTSVSENNSTNTVIGTLTASDPDFGNTFTFSLISGAGSTDNSSFVLSGNTLRIAPSTNFELKSSYTIRVLVADQSGLSFEKPYTISVIDMNEPPTIIGLTAHTIQEDTATGSQQFLIGDPETPAGNLSVSATSSDTMLIPGANIVFSGTGATRSLIVTPAANQYGSATITVFVSDGIVSSSQTFQITVQSVDDPAIITLTSQPLVYRVSTKKIVTIDETVTISDIDSPTLMFSGSALRVSGQGTKDTLSILKQNGISVKGNSVFFGATIIGAFTGGKKAAPLMVFLNSAATQNSVQILMQSIGFKSTDKVAGNRSLQFQFTNLNGKNTNSPSRQIQVIR